MILSKFRLLASTAGKSLVRSTSVTATTFLPPKHKPQLGYGNSITFQREFSVRRRRRGSSVTSSVRNEEDEEDEKRLITHEAVTDASTFKHEADKLLAKMEAALRPMEKHNEVFVITHTPRNHYSAGSLTLELPPDDGTYSLEVDDDARVIHFQSATSGQYSYILSATTGEWVDEKDGHAFEGMLVRDLIRQCNGLPNL